MFHIKREDYNSVQFMPDYSSSSIQANDKSGRSGSIFFVIAVLVAILIILAAGVCVYFTFFSPANKFVSAFENGDYTLCQELSEENAFDSGFTASIQETVISGARAAVNNYKTGNISSQEATDLLDTYDTATYGCFKDIITEFKGEIAQIDAVHAMVTEAQDTLIAKKYLDGINLIMSARNAASQINMDIDNEISSIIETYADSIKYSLFSEFASKFRANDLDTISAYLDTITAFSADPDYDNISTVLASVRTGNVSSSQAAKTASSVIGINDDDDEDEDEDEDDEDEDEEDEDD